MLKTNIVFMFFILLIIDNALILFEVSFLNITFFRLFLAFLILLYFVNCLKHQKIHFNKNLQIYNLFFYIWFFDIISSVLWAQDKYSVLSGIFYFLIYYIVMLCITKLVDEKMENRVVKILQFSAFIVLFLALIEYLDYFRFSNSRYYGITNHDLFLTSAYKAVTGPFHNENDFSLFLGFLFPFLIIGILKSKKSFKCLFLILTLFLTYLVYFNNSKLVLIMLVFQVFCFFIFIKWKKFSSSVKYLVSFFCVIFLIVTVIGVLIPYTIELVKASFNNSANIRLNLILTLKYSMLETHFLGAGIGNFKFVIDPNLYTGGIVNPHNWWVELMVEHGLLIFILYSIVFTSLIFNLYSVFKKSNGENLLALAIMITMLGTVIGALSPSSYFNFWPMWFWMGIGLAVINNSRKAKDMVK